MVRTPIGVVDRAGLRLEQRTEPVELSEIATLVVGVEWSAIAAGTFVQCDVGNDLDGCSLIWLAAEAGKASVLMALLKAGGDPSTPNKKKTTPVHIAAQRHDAEAIRALLAAAAERGGGDSQGDPRRERRLPRAGSRGLPCQMLFRNRGITLVHLHRFHPGMIGLALGVVSFQ